MMNDASRASKAANARNQAANARIQAAKARSVNLMQAEFEQAHSELEALQVVRRYAQNKELQDAQFFYSRALKVCIERRHWQLALSLLRQMFSDQQPPNLVCYNSAMHCCVKSEKADQAHAIYQSLVANVRPDLFSYSTEISAFAQQGDVRGALNVLLIQMERAGIEPNEHAYCATITACHRGGMIEEAFKVFGLLQLRGLKPNSRIYASVLAACKTGGQGRAALKIIHKMMPDDGVTPDAYSYSAAIAACTKACMAKQAIELFYRMRSQGIATSVVTYGAVFNACLSGNFPDASLAILDIMLAEPKMPDHVCLHSIMKVLKRNDRYQDAYDVVDKLHQLRINPGIAVFDAVVGMCLKAGQVELARRVSAQALSHGVRTQRYKTLMKEALDMDAELHKAATEGDGQKVLDIYHAISEAGHRPSIRSLQAAVTLLRFLGLHAWVQAITSTFALQAQLDGGIHQDWRANR